MLALRLRPESLFNKEIELQIKINDEESFVQGVRLIKELVFNDQTLQAEIKMDYFYLLRLTDVIMDKISPESLIKDDSIGEALVRQFIVEVNQLTGKLAEIEHDCVKESAIEEAEKIVNVSIYNDEKEI